VKCPRQRGRVVGDVEDYRMGIVCDGRCWSSMGNGTIVDYHHHKLEDVDQYELAIIVVAPETGCTLNHFIRETNVQPESQRNQESSSGFKETISICHSKRRTRD
jgi:hypothetical protein